MQISRFSTLRWGLLLLLAGVWACAGPRESAREPEPDEAAKTMKTTLAADLNLADYRSQLDDVFASQQQDQPEIFQQKQAPKKVSRKDLYNGYRIQILSTRDMEQADRTVRNFNNWIDTTGINYPARSYVFFKQPYYRVHVGDFNEREKALNFTRLIKKKFPDAWIVHDRINPDNTPPDTLQIREVEKPDMGEQLKDKRKRNRAADSTRTFEQDGF